MLRIFLAGGLVSLLFCGCHKSGGGPAPTPGTCMLTTVTATSGGQTITYDLTYDDNYRLSVVKGSGGGSNPFVTTLTYGNHYINTINNFSGVIATWDSVVLDNMGNVIDIYINGSNAHNRLSYTRDEHGQLTSSTTYANGSITDESNFTAVNGDVVSGDEMGMPFTFTYYTDKGEQPTDALGIAFWMDYGKLVYNNRHLVKSYEDSNIREDCSYTFDDRGNVTTATIQYSGGRPGVTYHYIYDCK